MQTTTKVLFENDHFQVEQLEEPMVFNEKYPQDAAQPLNYAVVNKETGVQESFAGFFVMACELAEQLASRYERFMAEKEQESTLNDNVTTLPTGSDDDTEVTH